MFEINGVEQERRKYSYHFPTIDFKFQNTGNATACIWRFKIDILEIEIDIVPKLDFKYSVTDDGELIVSCTNNGWGNANNCKLTIDNPILNKVFAKSDLHHICDIKGGGGQGLFRLKPSISLRAIKTLAQQNDAEVPDKISMNSKLSRRNTSYPNKKQIAVPIEHLQIVWEYQDDNGFNHEGLDHVSPNKPGSLWLCKDRFKFDRWIVHYAQLISDVTYTTIIDPLQESRSKEYSISRKITPGDVERFHIMIGATMSCKLRLRFSFYIDKNSVIESEPFSINIWNPHDSQWHYDYRDGAELVRAYDDIKNKKENTKASLYENDFLRRALLGELLRNGETLYENDFLHREKLKQVLANYPFTPKMDS